MASSAAPLVGAISESSDVGDLLFLPEEHAINGDRRRQAHRSDNAIGKSGRSMPAITKPLPPRIGRPIAFTGDVDELSDTERRRVKRRIANRESARRVRLKRQEALCVMQELLEGARQRVAALAAQLQQSEAHRAALVQQAASVQQQLLSAKADTAAYATSQAPGAIAAETAPGATDASFSQVVSLPLSDAPSTFTSYNLSLDTTTPAAADNDVAHVPCDGSGIITSGLPQVVTMAAAAVPAAATAGVFVGGRTVTSSGRHAICSSGTYGNIQALPLVSAPLSAAKVSVTPSASNVRLHCSASISSQSLECEGSGGGGGGGSPANQTCPAGAPSPPALPILESMASMGDPLDCFLTSKPSFDTELLPLLDWP